MLLLIVGGAAFGGWYYSKARARTEGDQKKKEGKGKQAVVVTVAKATKGTVPIDVRVVGSVIPHRTVAVNSQIGGQLLNVYIKQGQFVTAGQTLFQIDSRPLQATLDQVRATMARDRAQIEQARLTVKKDAAAVSVARSNLSKDQALLNYALAEERRYTKLLAQGYVTAEQTEQQFSNARSLEATVQSDRANIESAQAALNADAANVNILQANLAGDMATERNALVQLSYTTIKAPIAGRTGALNLYQGAIIRANDTTPLITIDDITPADVTFAVPEQYVDEIRKRQRLGALSVAADLTGQGGGVEKGRVTFIDNTVDTTTGTINIRGTFANPSHKLWPGHYVTVTLNLGTQTNVVLVPEQAVQPGQNGDYLFVVDDSEDKLTVEARDVKVDRTLNGRAVISKGLKAGETVVTDGQLQLVPGATVRVRKPGEEGGGGDKGKGGKNGKRRRGAASGAPGEGASGAPADGASGAPEGNGKKGRRGQKGGAGEGSDGGGVPSNPGSPSDTGSGNPSGAPRTGGGGGGSAPNPPVVPNSAPGNAGTVNAPPPNNANTAPPPRPGPPAGSASSNAGMPVNAVTPAPAAIPSVAPPPLPSQTLTPGNVK